MSGALNSSTFRAGALSCAPAACPGTVCADASAQPCFTFLPSNQAQVYFSPTAAYGRFFPFRMQTIVSRFCLNRNAPRTHGRGTWGTSYLGGTVRVGTRGSHGGGGVLGMSDLGQTVRIGTRGSRGGGGVLGGSVILPGIHRTPWTGFTGGKTGRRGTEELLFGLQAQKTLSYILAQHVQVRGFDPRSRSQIGRMRTVFVRGGFRGGKYVPATLRTGPMGDIGVPGPPPSDLKTFKDVIRNVRETSAQLRPKRTLGDEAAFEKHKAHSLSSGYSRKYGTYERAIYRRPPKPVYREILPHLRTKAQAEHR